MDDIFEKLLLTQGLVSRLGLGTIREAYDHYGIPNSGLSDERALDELNARAQRDVTEGERRDAEAFRAQREAARAEQARMRAEREERAREQAEINKRDEREDRRLREIEREYDRLFEERRQTAQLRTGGPPRPITASEHDALRRRAEDYVKRREEDREYDRKLAERRRQAREANPQRKKTFDVRSIAANPPGGIIPGEGSREARDTLNLPPLEDIPSPAGLDYFEHQKDAIQKIYSQPATYLADDMGLGKTASALGAVNALGEHGERVLVVVPNHLKSNWADEARMWLVDDRPIVEIESPGKGGWTAPATGPALVIVGNPQMSKQNYGEQLRGGNWDMIVVDESHLYKGPKTKGAQHLSKLTAPRKVAMSGTPIPNYPDDLWFALDWLQPGQWGSHKSFGDRYVEWDDSGRYKKKLGPANAAELHRRLEGNVMLTRNKELLDLPPKTREFLYPPDSPAIQKLLDQERDRLLALKGAPKDNILAEINRIRQVSALARVPYVVDAIERAHEEDGPVVAVGWHREVIDRIVADARKRGMTADAIYGGMNKEQRDRVVRDFQGGDLDLVAINYLSGGTGLTLTASNRVVVAELPWKAAELSQAEDRTHRIGQKRPVTSQFVLFAGGIDDRMMELISNKARSQKDVVGVAAANDLTQEGAFTADMLDFLISGDTEKPVGDISYDTWRLARGLKTRRYIVRDGNVGVTDRNDRMGGYNTAINTTPGSRFDLLRDAQGYVMDELGRMRPQTSREAYGEALRFAVDPDSVLGAPTAKPVQVEVVVDEPAVKTLFALSDVAPKTKPVKKTSMKKATPMRRARKKKQPAMAQQGRQQVNLFGQPVAEVPKKRRRRAPKQQAMFAI